jgi:hypothetical protein
VDVRVAGAKMLDESSFFRDAASLKNLEDLIRRLNARRKADRIYVQLVTGAPGEIIAGQELPVLPASVREVVAGGNRSDGNQPSTEVVWVESELNMPGVVLGAERVRIEVK